MDFSVGIDIEKTSRFKTPKVKRNFIKFVFSDKEIALCQKYKAPHLAFAGKFCAKEAVLKALRENVDIRNIEVLNSATGEPEIYISGKKRSDIKCSVSHIKDTAIAVVIIAPTSILHHTT